MYACTYSSAWIHRAQQEFHMVFFPGIHTPISTRNKMIPNHEHGQQNSSKPKSANTQLPTRISYSIVLQEQLSFLCIIRSKWHLTGFIYDQSGFVQEDWALASQGLTDRHMHMHTHTHTHTRMNAWAYKLYTWARIYLHNARRWQYAKHAAFVK